MSQRPAVRTGGMVLLAPVPVPVAVPVAVAVPVPYGSFHRNSGTKSLLPCIYAVSSLDHTAAVAVRS